QRLQERVAGAAVERDALLQLGCARRVLQEEDVRERMAGADHRDARPVARLCDLVAESVDLGDGLLQVLLIDLVRRHQAPRMVRSSRTLSLACATHFSPCRYASDFGRRRISPLRSDTRNSSGPSKRRMRTAPVPTPCSTCASEPAPAVRLYFRAKRAASSLYASKSRRAL